jgi:imidazolonepropionase-like amidohydrolase
VPEGARHIDGTGKYLMPGLADMHVHLEYTEDPAILGMFLANGVTTVRNMDGRPFIVEWKRRTADGSLPGPTIHTAGPLLDGDPPLRPDNTVVRSASEARAAVMAQHAAGYDFIKVYTNLSTDAYRAVLSTARERGLKVAGHVPRTVSWDEALTAGQDTFEHLSDYDDVLEADDSPSRGRYTWFKRFLAMPLDPAKMAGVAQRQSQSRTWTVPTLVQADREIARPAQVQTWLAATEASLIPAEARAFWQQQVARSTARMGEEDWAAVSQGSANRLAVVRALHKAGVHLLAGTDTPNPFVVPGFALPEELANLTRAGLTPLEALAASTREAAVFLGQSDEWGTVDSGKRADLVLLGADPLKDIANVRAISGVMVRGRWLAAADLKGALKTLAWTAK